MKTYNQTTNDRIREAGWFDGTVNDWDRLTDKERLDRSFQATGCQVAYPTWESPVDCVHTGCQIRRGEIPPICLTNRILRSEMHNGWLRFQKDSRAGRKALATICRHIRNTALATGVYDPWKMENAWKIMVSAAVSEL